jgi:hypothetical protein
MKSHEVCGRQLKLLMKLLEYLHKMHVQLWTGCEPRSRVGKTQWNGDRQVGLYP